MNTDRSTAYNDGWYAQQNNISVDDNPYEENSQQCSHLEWIDGWCTRYNGGQL